MDKQADTEVVEDKEKESEREKSGLLRDLVEQRKKNRALEERISLIESSLNSAEQEPEQPADARVQRFAQDPDAYIKEVVTPILSNELTPLRKAMTQDQIERKLERAMEFIAEEEGLTKRETAKKFEKKLSEIVETHDFGKLDPYDGTLAAYKILQTEDKRSKEKEVERDRSISGQHTETVRTQAPSHSGKKWTTSEISRLTRKEFEENRDSILKAQREGTIVRDT